MRRRPLVTAATTGLAASCAGDALLEGLLDRGELRPRRSADAAGVVVLVVVDGVLLGLLVVLVVGSGEAWLALLLAGQDAETEERRGRDGEQGDDPEDERQRRSPLRTVFSHVQSILPMRR